MEPRFVVQHPQDMIQQVGQAQHRGKVSRESREESNSLVWLNRKPSVWSPLDHGTQGVHCCGPILRKRLLCCVLICAIWEEDFIPSPALVPKPSLHDRKDDAIGFPAGVHNVSIIFVHMVDGQLAVHLDQH